MSLAIL